MQKQHKNDDKYGYQTRDYQTVLSSLIVPEIARDLQISRKTIKKHLLSYAQSKETTDLGIDQKALQDYLEQSACL